MPSDAVDIILEEWDRSRPQLDVTGLAVMSRILLLAKHFRQLETKLLERAGLTPWAFEVLSALLRQGPPYRLSPTELRRHAVLSSGAMTNRLDRLEGEGLVKRSADPKDRRGVVITLLPRGRKLAEQAIAERLTRIDRLLQPLDKRARAATAQNLKKLMLDLTLP